MGNILEMFYCFQELFVFLKFQVLNCFKGLRSCNFTFCFNCSALGQSNPTTCSKKVIENHAVGTTFCSEECWLCVSCTAMVLRDVIPYLSVTVWPMNSSVSCPGFHLRPSGARHDVSFGGCVAILVWFFDLECRVCFVSTFAGSVGCAVNPDTSLCERDSNRCCKALDQTNRNHP